MENTLYFLEAVNFIDQKRAAGSRKTEENESGQRPYHRLYPVDTEVSGE